MLVKQQMDIGHLGAIRIDADSVNTDKFFAAISARQHHISAWQSWSLPGCGAVAKRKDQSQEYCAKGPARIRIGLSFNGSLISDRMTVFLSNPQDWLEAVILGPHPGLPERSFPPVLPGICLDHRTVDKAGQSSPKRHCQRFDPSRSYCHRSFRPSSVAIDGRVPSGPVP